MIRRNAPKGTKIYNDDLGLFGELTGNVNSKNVDLVEVDFDDFSQYCYRKNLTEIEN